MSGTVLYLPTTQRQVLPSYVDGRLTPLEIATYTHTPIISVLRLSSIMTCFWTRTMFINTLISSRIEQTPASKSASQALQSASAAILSLENT